MSEESYRPVPPLYWFMTPWGTPTTITAYGEGNEAFVVFSSLEKARSYQRLLGLPLDWHLIHSNVADHIIRVCREVRDVGIEIMILDPPTDDTPPQGRSPDNMIQLIDNTAVFVEEHGLGVTSWPAA